MITNRGMLRLASLLIVTKSCLIMIVIIKKKTTRRKVNDVNADDVVIGIYTYLIQLDLKTSTGSANHVIFMHFLIMISKGAKWYSPFFPADIVTLNNK